MYYQSLGRSLPCIPFEHDFYRIVTASISLLSEVKMIKIPMIGATIIRENMLQILSNTVSNWSGYFNDPSWSTCGG